jgi:NAD-specific glutamate dehydrogenase
MIACKEELVALVGLPDLALVSEAHYVRHRSLSDVFSYFNESPELLEYFPSTFVYHYAPSSNPSRIERVF